MVRGPRTAMKSGPHLPQLKRALARKRGPSKAGNQSINQSNLKNKKTKKPLNIFCAQQYEYKEDMDGPW